MASEQFSLCWDNFHKNMSSGMNSLLENEDLVDVTLAVQGKCLKAHKMVLSVCSPYFKELFKSNPCKHPIVFMKDVSYEALSDLLQFMYQGEVQVSQENLTTFIKTAEALQIKGLTGDGNGSADTEVPEMPEKPHVEEYKPTPRPKKQQSTPIVTQPSIKRQRLCSSEPQVPQAITKTEPASQSQSDSAVQFKMEPYDQNASLIDEAGDDNFGDDNLDDTANDDNEDYSMMESSMTGEEEPQAGTSADGAGEGQVLMYRTMPEGRFGEFIVIDRFVYKYYPGRASVRSEWCCTMRDTSNCNAKFYFQDGFVVVQKRLRHNHAYMYVGDLEKCSIEIARIRLESSMKRNAARSLRNGDKLKLKSLPGSSVPEKVAEKKGSFVKKDVSSKRAAKSSDSDSAASASPKDRVKSKMKKLMGVGRSDRSTRSRTLKRRSIV